MVRTLFWFRDGQESLSELTYRFFPLAVLHSRLFNEQYDKGKLQYINLYFNTEKTFQLSPHIKKGHTHFKGPYLKHDDVFEVNTFTNFSANEQKQFLWKMTYQIIKAAAKSVKSNNVLEACEYAYHEGLRLELNPDYKSLETEVLLQGKKVKAALWINFWEDGMSSKLTLEKDGKVFFEKPIDKTVLGVEFFLVMYKKIQAEDNKIIIRGHYDVEYLPLTIPVAQNLIPE